VAAPMLGPFFRGRSLDNEARRLLAVTHYAQSRAINEGVPFVVWFDQRNRNYGVEEDSNYENTKSDLVFTLDGEMTMEVVATRRRNYTSQNNFLGNRGRFSSTPIVKQSISEHRNLPSMRFLEDGTVGEDSPEMIRLRGRTGDTLLLAQMRDSATAGDAQTMAMRAPGYEIRQDNGR
jgi:hypothetical protein